MSGIAVTVDGTTRASVEQAFDLIAPIDLTSIFTGYGPLPAVVAIRGQTGDWDRIGATRTVELSDGSVTHERLTAYERPRSFGYRVGPFTGALGLLVGHADGDWCFVSTASGATAIRWTYTFAPRPLAGPLVRLVAAPLWRRYARRVLALAVEQTESAAGYSRTSATIAQNSSAR